MLTHIACDGKRFIVHADEKLSAFVELEREVLTVTICSNHSMALIEIRPHRWGWKAFQSAGVEPVFSNKDQAKINGGVNLIFAS